MRRLALALPVLAVLLAVPATSRAESGGKPISLGLVTPVQIVPEARASAASASACSTGTTPS